VGSVLSWTLGAFFDARRFVAMVRSRNVVRLLRAGALVAVLLFPWFALLAQPAPELAAISILGVQPAMEAPPEPDDVPAAVPVLGVPAAPIAPAVPGCGADIAGVQGRIHAGGRKTALIIRGGRFGINQQVLGILKRIADVFEVDPSVQRFLRTYLQEQYISDDRQVKARLEAMGYHVEHKTSLGYANNLGQMKADVLEVLRRPETTLVVFYGHGSTWGAWLTDDRENNAPGLAELLRRPEERHPEQVLSVDDVKAARGSNPLDGMIMHGCQQGTNPYLKEIKGTNSDATFADCVKPDGMGFYAGWVTYSTYLDPRTMPILDRYFCHVATRDTLAADARKRSSRFWTRTSAIGRKMTLLAFGSDGSSLDEAVLAADPEVHGHDFEYLSDVVPVRLFIELLCDLKMGNGTLAADVRKFLIDYYRYVQANDIPMRQAGQGEPPRLSPSPTTAELNRLIAYHGRIMVGEALQAIAPGLVELKSKRVYFSDAQPEKLFADLEFEVRRASELDEVVRLLRRLYEQQIADGLSTGVGGAIGPQLGARISSTLDELVRALDTQLVAVTVELSLEKAKKPDGTTNTVRPTIYGYNLCVGDLSHARRASRDAPYEIHMSLATVERLFKRAATSMFGSEIKVYESRLVDLYARMHGEPQIVRTDNQTLWVRMKVEVRGDWALVSDGFGYLWADITLNVTPGGGLKVNVRPSVGIRFLDGWPFPAWVGRIIATKVAEKVTAKLRERIGTVDFAPYFPEAVRGEVAGVVKIDHIGFDWEALKVLIRHER
jgi:hypothetical protein